jgi:hypothetical protein
VRLVSAIPSNVAGGNQIEIFKWSPALEDILHHHIHFLYISLLRPAAGKERFC